MDFFVVSKLDLLLHFDQLERALCFVSLHFSQDQNFSQDQHFSQDQYFSQDLLRKLEFIV